MMSQNAMSMGQPNFTPFQTQAASPFSSGQDSKLSTVDQINWQGTPWKDDIKGLGDKLKDVLRQHKEQIDYIKDNEVHTSEDIGTI